MLKFEEVRKKKTKEGELAFTMFQLPGDINYRRGEAAVPCSVVWMLTICVQL